MLEKILTASNGYRLLLVAVPAFLALALLLPSSTTKPVLRVAFIGNSITFVNDLPRFIEALGGNRYIVQDSCLSGAKSFLSLTYRGNGMANKWRYVTR